MHGSEGRERGASDAVAHGRRNNEVLGKGSALNVKVATAHQQPTEKRTKSVSTRKGSKDVNHAHRKTAQSPRLKLAKSASV